MSTIAEITESKVTINFRPEEGLLQSFAKSVITFSFLGLCIYLSHGSNWWTLVTGVMFLLFLWTKIVVLIRDNATTFANKDKAIEYLKGLN